MEIEVQQDMQPADTLESSFQRDIRPMLDLVDKIQAQSIIEENIQVPTIVVVGDQRSGKSSVIESLSGITLLRGQGIATCIPLVLRLQSCGFDKDSIIKMDYEDVKDQVIDSKGHIEVAINFVTIALANFDKGVRDTPIQLLIRKPNAPDLTMVDLPGITHILVHGQLRNIYEMISGMIMPNITPKESIILNVLSAQANFPTCEWFCMLQQANREGKRTLVVITKVDKAPEGLLKKVVNDAIIMSLNYVCMRNRTDNDNSTAIAQLCEKELIKSHPTLRELDRSIVGIPALARKLTMIQSDMVKGCLLRIEKQLHEVLVNCRLQLNKLPKEVKSSSDARVLFYQISDKVFTLLSQVVSEGNFVGFPGKAHLCYPTRLHKKFQDFADKIHEAGKKFKDKLQTKEIAALLAKHQRLGLPNFVPHPVWHYLMNKKIEDITRACMGLVKETFEYATKVVLHITTVCGQGYPRLVRLYKEIATEALEEVKNSTMVFVESKLEKESSMIFTINNDYITTIQKMNAALREVQQNGHGPVTPGPVFNEHGEEEAALVVVLGEEEDNVSLKELYNKDQKFQEAGRVKVSAAAYWKVVQNRLANEIPKEIKFALQHAIVDGLHKKMMTHPWSAALMEEDALVAFHSSRLQLRMDALKDCLHLLSGVMH